MELLQNLRYMRKPILLSSVLLLVGLGMALPVYLAEEGAARERDRVLQARHQARIRWAQVDGGMENARNGAALLRHLSDRGVIGEERRMAYIEGLQEIRRSRGLFNVRWELLPRQSLANPSVSGRSGAFQPGASRLKFSLPLLHEDDLMGLLDDMGNRLPALVHPLRCRIERMPGEQYPSSEALMPRLEAACEVDLITFRPVPEPAKAGRGAKP